MGIASVDMAFIAGTCILSFYHDAAADVENSYDSVYLRDRFLGCNAAFSHITCPQTSNLISVHCTILVRRNWSVNGRAMPSIALSRGIKLGGAAIGLPFFIASSLYTAAGLSIWNMRFSTYKRTDEEEASTEGMNES
jgi:hypothetical protein